MSYYDIDAILTDAQKVPSKFEISVPNGGYLDGNAGQDLKEGTLVDLPYWLSSVLASGITRDPSIPAPVTLDVPPSLSRRVINALKAGPRAVDLRAQAPHFYGLAALVFELLEDEETVDVLVDTFKSRASKIADHAHNPYTATTTGFSSSSSSSSSSSNPHPNPNHNNIGVGATTGTTTGSGSSASADTDFLRGLDELERRLFRAAHDGAKGVRVWIAEGGRA